MLTIDTTLLVKSSRVEGVKSFSVFCFASFCQNSTRVVISICFVLFYAMVIYFVCIVMEWLWIGLLVVILAIVGLWLFARLGILDRPGADIVPARKPVPTMQ